MKPKKAVVIDSEYKIIINYDNYDITLLNKVEFFSKNKRVAIIPSDKIVLFYCDEADEIIIQKR